MYLAGIDNYDDEMEEKVEVVEKEQKMIEKEKGYKKGVKKNNSLCTLDSRLYIQF